MIKSVSLTIRKSLTGFPKVIYRRSSYLQRLFQEQKNLPRILSKENFHDKNNILLRAKEMLGEEKIGGLKNIIDKSMILDHPFAKVIR